MAESTTPDDSAEVAASSTSRTTAKRLSEFVYGVVMAMVALAPFIEHSEGASGFTVAIAVVGGAVAIWLAHAFSELVGERATARHSFGLAEGGLFLRQSWPIVLAGFFVAIPVVLSETGIWTLSVGLTLGNVFGLLSLGAIGVAVGVVERSGAARTLWNAAFAVGIGAVVILIERAAHHLG